MIDRPGEVPRVCCGGFLFGKEHMTSNDTKEPTMTCPTCGVWQAVSMRGEESVVYFVVEREVQNDSTSRIKKALCRTCGSAAIIDESPAV